MNARYTLTALTLTLLILACPAGAALVEMSAWGTIDEFESTGAGLPPEFMALLPPDPIGQPWQWTIVDDTSTAETPAASTDTRFFEGAIVSAEFTLGGTDMLSLLDPGAINHIALASSAGDFVSTAVDATAMAGVFDVNIRGQFVFDTDMFPGDNDTSTIPIVLPVYQTSDFISAEFSVQVDDGLGGVFLGAAAEGFYVSIIPEPATLSLLAFGGLAILRRRSRR